MPSPSSVFRYLENFHDEEEETLREEGKAFIPRPNGHLRGLVLVNKDMVASVQRHDPKNSATLDMDATILETSKNGAAYCYKGFKAYQPMNVYWGEQGLVLHTEFRDGNVPAGYEQLRVLIESLEILPEGVEKVRLRSDTAGYQHDLMRYCEMGKSERFGRIEFAIGCDVSKEFKEAAGEARESEWQPIYREVNGKRVKTGREWAEVCFVPSAIAHSKKDPEYRYLAIREVLEQPELIDGAGQRELPFAAMTMHKRAYKVSGIVTNMDWSAQELIYWHYERCGKSEEAHSVMKEDFAGSRMPSGDFGENAAWWWVMVLAMNLNSAMKRLVLGGEWTQKRMKSIRYGLINLPARVCFHARELSVRLSSGHPSFELLVNARARIAQLAHPPSG